MTQTHDTALAPASTFTVLGEVLSLAAQCPLYKSRSLDAFSQLILPPLTYGQFRIWRRGGMPVGFATWAFLDVEREIEVLRRDGTLAPDAWCCGDRPVVMDLVAPFGDGYAIGRDLTRSVFPGRAFTAARRNPDGSLRKVVQFPGRSAQGDWTRARAFSA